MSTESEIRNVLIVEDNLAEARLMLRCLSECGVPRDDTHLVRDGVEALDFLLSCPPPDHRRFVPDLILMDLKLPRVDGHEVLRCIRANAMTRHIPVVIVSSSSAPADIALSIDAGANSYVVKPLEFEHLRAFVTSAAGYWLRWNRTAPNVAADGRPDGAVTLTGSGI